MRSAAILALLAFLTVGIEAAKGTSSGTDPNSPAERGAIFAQGHCSSCHAVAKGKLSPNPEAPPFEVIVNAPDLGPATLAAWLRDSHNFPEKMNFAVAPDRIDDLTAYMLTLRSADYAPPIQ